MIITKITEDAELGQPFFRFLMSDLHLGSVNADHNAIVRDFEKARRIGARVLVNGDIFDAIGPMDRRFDLTVLHPDLAREKDLAAGIVKLAKDLLYPYRDLIDIIGIGNHEQAWIKYNHGDPVRSLIRELSEGRSGARKIVHGSFEGYIRTGFRVAGYRKQAVHKLYYRHGTGGDSPVTKGTIDFNRIGRNFQFDAQTFGHKHNLICGVDQLADVSDRGRYTERKQLNLQTGSYYRNHAQLADKTVLDGSYAANSGHPPKPMGGIVLILRPDLDDATGELCVKQDFASDVVVPWSKRRRKAS